MDVARKFRLYPTSEQQISLAKSFGCCRFFWNYSLKLCQQTYQQTGKGLSRQYIQGLLPSLKQQYPWLKNDVYSQCLQVVALNLANAYKNFFEKRAKLPRFKSKKGRQSITFPQNAKFEGDYLKLPKIGKVYCRRHRDLGGKPKSITVSQNPDGQYYASVVVEDGKEQPEPNPNGKAIGIDLGLNHFAITSDGSKIDNPRHLYKHQTNLKRKQRKLSRKQPGSKNYRNFRKRVARIHSRVCRTREDFCHKLSRKIVNENQVIVVENLNVKGMVKNHNLAKAISDVGWGQFCTMLQYKAEWEGKVYQEVDRFFPSSKTCHVCLNQVGDMPLEVRTWKCQNCDTTHDRDINASINIKNEGLRILELGTSSTALGGDVRRTGKTSVLLDAIPDERGSSNLSEAG